MFFFGGVEVGKLNDGDVGGKTWGHPSQVARLQMGESQDP